MYLYECMHKPRTFHQSSTTLLLIYLRSMRTSIDTKENYSIINIELYTVGYIFHEMYGDLYARRVYTAAPSVCDPKTFSDLSMFNSYESRINLIIQPTRVKTIYSRISIIYAKYVKRLKQLYVSFAVKHKGCVFNENS